MHIGSFIDIDSLTPFVWANTVSLSFSCTIWGNMSWFFKTLMLLTYVNFSLFWIISCYFLCYCAPFFHTILKWFSHFSDSCFEVLRCYCCSGWFKHLFLLAQISIFFAVYLFLSLRFSASCQFWSIALCLLWCW